MRAVNRSCCTRSVRYAIVSARAGASRQPASKLYHHFNPWLHIVLAVRRLRPDTEIDVPGCPMPPSGRTRAALRDALSTAGNQSKDVSAAVRMCCALGQVSRVIRGTCV